MRVEEYFIPPTEAEGGRNPDGREEGPRQIRYRGPARNIAPGHRRYRRPPFLVASITVFLLAGGTFYFFDGNTGRKSSGDAIAVQERSAPEHPVFEVRDLKGYLDKQVSGDPLYIVKGTVKNNGKDMSGGIRVEATLLGKGNQAIVKSETYAGNVIDEKLISHMTRLRIEAFLDMRHGEGNVNRDIPTGKTLPFMMVFFDPPEAVESFAVKAVNTEETGRPLPWDAKESGAHGSSQQTIGWN